MSDVSLKSYKRLITDAKADLDGALARYVAACVLYSEARDRERAKRKTKRKKKAT